MHKKRDDILGKVNVKVYKTEDISHWTLTVPLLAWDLLLSCTCRD